MDNRKSVDGAAYVHNDVAYAVTITCFNRALHWDVAVKTLAQNVLAGLFIGM